MTDEFLHKKIDKLETRFYVRIQNLENYLDVSYNPHRSFHSSDLENYLRRKNRIKKLYERQISKSEIKSS